MKLVDRILTAEEIRMYRLAIGLSQQELADMLLISKQAISLTECRESKEHNRLMMTLAIEKLWAQIPEDEKEWRLICGKIGKKADEKGAKVYQEFYNAMILHD